jgi:hypothetical protein
MATKKTTAPLTDKFALAIINEIDLNLTRDAMVTVVCDNLDFESGLARKLLTTAAMTNEVQAAVQRLGLALQKALRT